MTVSNNSPIHCPIITYNNDINAIIDYNEASSVINGTYCDNPRSCTLLDSVVGTDSGVACNGYTSGKSTANIIGEHTTYCTGSYSCYNVGHLSTQDDLFCQGLFSFAFIELIETDGFIIMLWKQYYYWTF